MGKRNALLIVYLLAIGQGLALAAEYFAGADGKADNPGTREAPWDLESALAGRRGIAPGDTLWVRDGIYKGKFEIKLAGTEAAPIQVRACPGERATIQDCGLRVVKGAGHVWVWDLELCGTTPEERRKTGLTGSHPEDLPGTSGLDVYDGPGCKFINLVIHDNAHGGVGWWAGSTDSEMHGCIIYGNGWHGPDRNHGHCIYTQNREGLKTISGCILSVPYGGGQYTMHAYGSERAFVDHFLIEDNIAWGRGTFLVGGGKPSHAIRVLHNLLYRSDMLIGSGAKSEDCEVRGNVVAGGSLTIKNYSRAVESGNMQKEVPAGRAVLIPNRYDPRRANVAIYNGGRAKSVAVKVEDFLKAGERYRLMDPLEFYGRPVAEGVCAGETIDIPMASDFRAFVLLKAH